MSAGVGWHGGLAGGAAGRSGPADWRCTPQVLWSRPGPRVWTWAAQRKAGAPEHAPGRRVQPGESPTQHACARGRVRTCAEAELQLANAAAVKAQADAEEAAALAAAAAAQVAAQAEQIAEATAAAQVNSRGQPHSLSRILAGLALLPQGLLLLVPGLCRLGDVTCLRAPLLCPSVVCRRRRRRRWRRRSSSRCCSGSSSSRCSARPRRRCSSWRSSGRPRRRCRCSGRPRRRRRRPGQRRRW